MATQHPDNASVPWWRGDAFIPTQDEIDELLLLFRELPIDEYMWDWEGKYVDESVGEKIYAKAGEFFRHHPLGEDVHLTYRIPTWEEGRAHRMARAFMNILSLADLAKDLKLPRPPVTEMFHPLTTSADQLLAVRKAFREIADYHRSVFHRSQEDEHRLLDRLAITPLIEDIDSLCHCDRILVPYWEALEKEERERKDQEDERKQDARGRRVFLARSDPAENAGLVPAVLAARSALSILAELSERFALPVHPIVGTGSLPFRGGVSPHTTATFLTQYSGTRTYSIQSAFRYDYPLEDVTRALQEIRRETPKRQALRFTPQERDQLFSITQSFTGFYAPVIEELAPLINTIAKHVPARRERLLHIGLFGYSRGVGTVKLPRAIVFTAALYSLGVPPELIGTGRGLREAQKNGTLDLLLKAYPALKEDLRTSGAYLNHENLALLAREYPSFRQIQEDLQGIQNVLGIVIGPVQSAHTIHRNLTSTILHRLRQDGPSGELIQRDIVEAALLRRSLG